MPKYYLLCQDYFREKSKLIDLLRSGRLLFRCVALAIGPKVISSPDFAA